MAAAATDHLRKVAPKWVAQVGSGGITDNTGTTIPLSSVTGLPTDTAVTVTFDRVDSNGVKTPSLEETVVGVVSGSNLVNCIRGVEGTAQAHVAGAVAEVLFTSTGWNDVMDAVLVGHNQDGTHKSGSVLTLPQINDTSSDHQYVFSVCELTADRTVALPLLSANDEFTFLAHTQTLTNKTLTTPIIASFYQDAGKTKLMTTPNTASDTLAAIAATQTLTNKTLTSPVLQGDVSGWTADTDTWVYVSASTFKISGKNVTSKFIAGTRLRFKQGGAYKYAVVISSAFSTNTTVTIAVNTDYTVDNAVITDNYYSYESCPQGYPDWFAFTPAWANLTEGSATNVGAYSLIGKTLTFRAKIVFAANTSVDGSVTLTLPVTINTAYTSNCTVGEVTIVDSGVGRYLGTIYKTGAICVSLATGTYVADAALSSSAPMTWTTNDTLEVIGTYQIA
jgi:hypothetical protein